MSTATNESGGVSAAPPEPRVVGVAGAGQLARMMQQAAIALGIELKLLADAADDSAAQVTPGVTVGSPRNEQTLRNFAKGVDVLTFDYELVEPSHLEAVEGDGTPVRPGSGALAVAQNKLLQREQLGDLGIELAPWALVDPELVESQLQDFGAVHGWPLVLKTVRGGYDGRGVWVVEDLEEAKRIADEVYAKGLSLLVEQYVVILRELAALVVRGPAGDCAAYPVVESVQRDGICVETVSPARVDRQLAAQAQQFALAVAERIDVTGILAVELFETEHGLRFCELAARPHNTGHHTIEGAVTSQFENHLRGVLGWPIGATSLVAPAVAMVNVIGGDKPPPESSLQHALAIPGANVHLYGKQYRPGRKLGHVTALGGDADDALMRARKAAELLAP